MDNTYPEDTFLTIATPSEGLYKELGSKFLAFAYPVNNEEDIKNHIENLKKKYYDARHHCYAYTLGKNKEVFRANDDGEPSSSAGKPILGQIYSFDVTNILIVVVRYFGGKKLGVGGLITAYKEAASDALKNAKIIPFIMKKDIKVSCDFSDIELVMRLVKNYDLEVLEQNYTAKGVVIILRIRENLCEEVIALLQFGKIVHLN